MDHITNPIDAFLTAYSEVQATAPAPYEPTAATLATADPLGRPSARVVLVRIVDERGFTFFTNYRSRKAQEIETNAYGALSFWWYWREEQVRVEGRLERIAPEDSDAYFAGRPRGSQVGAWASLQSDVLDARATLDERYLALEKAYDGREVPRPPHWGGYRLVPERIEFWKAGPYRLHNRWVFSRDGSAWTVERLYP